MTDQQTKEICIEYSYWKNRKTEYRGNGTYALTEAELQLYMGCYITTEEKLYDYFIKKIYNK